jgi:hypothetical protein
MTRDQAIKAVDASFEQAMGRLGEVFDSGMATGESIDLLCERYDRGYALAVTAHETKKARVEQHFKGKP